MNTAISLSKKSPATKIYYKETKMTDRFTECFKRLKQAEEGAFVPFVTLCDPNFDISYDILKTLINAGADGLELGIPFSDPCADGVTIQLADKRALSSGASLDKCFKLISKIRAEYNDVPISILCYSNIAIVRGLEKFYQDAAKAGIDAVLLADIPVEMVDKQHNFLKAANDADIDLILIAPPNASDATLKKIAELSQGYTYALSRYGITGTDNVLGKPKEMLRKLKEDNAAPALLGFGISTPEHVKEALEAGADGAIAGSAVVKIIENNLHDKGKMLAEIENYVKAMKKATKK